MNSRHTPRRVGLLLCLLLTGCYSERWQAVTPSAWAIAEKKCAANGGVSYVIANHLRSGGFRVKVTCENDMRAEFFSSAEAR